MTDNFENKVAVDGPVVNEGELGSSTFSPRPGISPAFVAGTSARWDGWSGWPDHQPKVVGGPLV